MKKLLIPAIQAVIIFSALIFWLVNRGSSLQNTLAPDELIVSETAVAAEDITTDSSRSSAGSLLTTAGLSLKAGTYQFLIDYNVNQEGSYISASSSQLGPMELRCSSVNLDPAGQTAVLTVELSRNVSDLQVNVYFSGAGSIRISSIIVAETSNLYKKTLFYAILLCLFINFMVYFYRADQSKRKVILALTGIFAAVCYPLYTDYLTVGHDLPFHLMRIEGIAEGLKAGIFPVKIHPLWAKGYGYAVGIFYGDALLYFPAILRLLGFSIQTAYKFFAAAMNLGTVLISYFSFKRIFCSRKMGIIGCLLYSTALYRLLDTYTRAAVGEYTAMLFFPLVLCGFYLIFTESDSKSWLKHSILTALGLTGLVQSHALSCEMAAVVILLACIVMIRRICNRRVILSLVLSAALTLLMNVGFGVPFLDYYLNSDLYITSPTWDSGVSAGFQTRGIFPVQLFTLFQHSNGGSWNTTAGVYNEFTVGIGIVFLIGILLFCYLSFFHFKKYRDDKNFVPAGLCCALGCLLLFMSTCYFPWDRLSSLGSGVEAVLNTLQFPWRLLAPATVLLTFTTCYTVSMLLRLEDRTTSLAIITGGFLLLAVNSGWYMYDFAFTGVPYRVYSATDLDTMSMYSYEYLPAATDPDKIVNNQILSNNITSWDSFLKKGLTIRCLIEQGNQEGYIDFPLNYYRYYTCKAVSSGEDLSVSSGSNGMLRVTFPANFRDTVLITFREPWFWRAAEATSLISFVCCCAALFLINRRNNRKKAH